MDGETNGKPYEQMDDLGGKKTYFWVNTHTRDSTLWNHLRNLPNDTALKAVEPIPVILSGPRGAGIRGV